MRTEGPLRYDPYLPKPEWFSPRKGTRHVCAKKDGAGKIYKLRFQLNVRKHFLKIRQSYTNSEFDKWIGVNKVSGVKWSWRGVLGLAWASSSLVLLKTVRPGDGEGLSQGHRPRSRVETFSRATLQSLRVLGCLRRMGAACSIPLVW